MARNKNGSGNAASREFAAEVLANKSALYSFCHSLAHSYDDANDLMQDTLERALKSWESYEPGSNMRAWLFTIAKNQFYSDKRRSWRSLPLDDLHVARIADERAAVSEREEGLQDFCAIAPLLGFLPIEFRDALIAIKYLDYSYEDAADLFECELGTLKSRVSRARETIRGLLHEQRNHPFDLSPWADAARDVPRNHPYYPIAKAYEDIYRTLNQRPELSLIPAKRKEPPAVRNRLDLAWEDLIASGALEDAEDFHSLIR